MSDSVVIIPTYNEKENIEAIIKAVLGLEEQHKFDVLVIDDNSPDGTAAIVERLMEEIPDRINIVKRSGKLGLGTAYIAGFKWKSLITPAMTVFSPLLMISSIFLRRRCHCSLASSSVSFTLLSSSSMI